MTSALRARAMNESAPTDSQEARVEPVFSKVGGSSPPVVTDVVRVGGPVGRLRHWVHGVLGWLALRTSLILQINPLAVALVVLGMGLAAFAIGLVMYVWPQTPSSPAVAVPVAAATVAPAAAEVSLPIHDPINEPTTLARGAEIPAMPVAASESTAAVVQPAEPVIQLSPLPSLLPAPVLADAKADVKADTKADAGFGEDADLNQVPDILDRWLSLTLNTPQVQEAGRAYYRTVLPLATKLHLGIGLSNAEKIQALRAAECYLLTATEGGLPVPPNLNNQVLMQGGDAAERMRALFKTLQGVEFVVSENRTNACA